MRTKFLIFVLLLVSFTSIAQQNAQYTQYMYNTININPAYAGSRGAMSIFGLYRTQWVGLDGAPETSAFSINSPIENNKIGVGLSFVNDRIGPTTENTISADASYTIRTSENYKLSFGVKGTANLFNLDISKLNPNDSGDPSLTDIGTSFTPNVGAGIYFHSDKSYIGLSVPNILQTRHYDDNSFTAYKEHLNGYLIGGYVFDFSSNLKFKPAFLVKAVEGSPLQVDVSGNFLINEKFNLGLAWRWSAAVSVMAGFQISDGLYIGYGYDLETTKLRRYNSGSHEIFLRFELFKKTKRIVSPRFF